MKTMIAAVILMLPLSAFAREAPNLNGQEIESLFSGATMRGEFIEGGAAWAERTTKSGRVLDLLRGGKHVGAWTVAGDQICYVYFGKPPSKPCYMVAWDHQSGALLFGDVKTGRTVARATRIETSAR